MGRPAPLAAPVTAPGAGRRWLIVAVITIAQLIAVLDATVVNIALPSAQRALHLTAADRQWVITAYALAFGSLLLPGGKLAGILGRKLTFIAGLIGFAAASAVGGAAVSFSMLVAARACQGAFGALLALAGPLLPRRIVLDRNRDGSYRAVLVVMAGVPGTFLFLTCYLQDTLHFSGRHRAGLPAHAGHRDGHGHDLRPGAAAAHRPPAAGRRRHARRRAEDGLAISPSMNSATFGVPDTDAGAASATANSPQQVGASIGTALLNTLAVTAAARYLTAHAAADGRPGAAAVRLAVVHGCTAAFWWAAGILTGGAIIIAALFRRSVLAGHGDIRQEHDPLASQPLPQAAIGA